MNRVLTKLFFVFLIAVSISTTARATTVTVDGIRNAGEYTGSNSGTRVLPWFNGHESIYTLEAGNTNPLHWEINDMGGDYSLNMFFEVPAFARRMIWGDDIKYDGTNFDPSWGIPKEYLDAYFEGTHHKSVNMSYGTQTGSEYFQLNGINLDKIKWQDEDENGLADNFIWKTSLQYLLEEGISTTSLSREFDRTASIELLWTGLSELRAQSLVNNITNMELHLSDEARGIPNVPSNPPPGVPPPAVSSGPPGASSPIPEPATATLAMLGLAGLVMRRRRVT